MYGLVSSQIVLAVSQSFGMPAGQNGYFVGPTVGGNDGAWVGAAVGLTVGCADGEPVGDNVARQLVTRAVELELEAASLILYTSYAPQLSRLRSVEHSPVAVHKSPYVIVHELQAGRLWPSSAGHSASVMGVRVRLSEQAEPQVLAGALVGAAAPLAELGKTKPSRQRQL